MADDVETIREALSAKYVPGAIRMEVEHARWALMTGHLGMLEGVESDIGELSNEQYMATQMILANLSLLINKLPLKAFVKQIERSETWGPMVDPTMYRRAVGKMDAIKQVAQASLLVQKAAQELIAASGTNDR